MWLPIDNNTIIAIVKKKQQKEGLYKEDCMVKQNKV